MILTSYTIRSGRWQTGCGHPLNWKIEGSNDNDSWETIDIRRTYELDFPHIVRNFVIENPKPTSFRYIRMKETGNCTHGNISYLAFDSFEMYGELIDYTEV